MACIRAPKSCAGVQLYGEPTATGSLSLHQHPCISRFVEPEELPATVFHTLEKVSSCFGRRSPRVHQTTLWALDRQVLSPRTVVDVCPAVFSDTQSPSERLRQHQNDIRVTAKLVGLAQHVRKCMGDRDALDENEFDEGEEKVRCETRLETRRGERNAGGDAVTGLM